MDWTFATVTFIAAVAIMGALVYALAPGEFGIAGRLSRLLNVAAPVREADFKEKQRERVGEALASVGALVSSKAPSSRSQLMMIRAGFRKAEVMQAINGLRLLLPVV